MRSCSRFSPSTRKRRGDENYQKLALFLRNDNQEIVGGLWAKRYYGWVFIELLFVPQALRGAHLGSQLLRQAEEWAREVAVQSRPLA